MRALRFGVAALLCAACTSTSPRLEGAEGPPEGSGANEAQAASSPASASARATAETERAAVATELAAAAPSAQPAPESNASSIDTRSALPDSRAARARSEGTDNIHVLATGRASLDRELSAWEVELRARTAFAALEPREQREVVDWLATEVRNLENFQSGLIAYVMREVSIDPGAWPVIEPAPWFDPELHAPKQPIERKPLAPDAPQARQARAQIFATVPPRRVRSGWVYDYAAREPRRLPDDADPTRIFENALYGMPPGWDYVEVLVERALDVGARASEEGAPSRDGSDAILQKTFEAFGHAYTDREGGVYPGITLFDAWASRSEIEMPDVDNLGIVHHALGDWETWKSVVPEEQHEALYGKIGELFNAALHHRGLCHNLARTFLCGSTELRDHYQGNLDRFHALWEEASSTPAILAQRLPKPEQWAEFLQSWSDELDADEMRFLKGVRRHFYLDRNGLEVRALILRLLEEYGAYR